MSIELLAAVRECFSSDSDPPKTAEEAISRLRGLDLGDNAGYKRKIREQQAEIDRLICHLANRQGDHEDAVRWRKVCAWCVAKGMDPDRESVREFLERVASAAAECQTAAKNLKFQEQTQTIAPSETIAAYAADDSPKGEPDEP